MTPVMTTPVKQSSPFRTLIHSSVMCLRRLACVVLLSSLIACSWFQFPGVYRLDIQQGNIITQEMVDQLKPGMTKRQVNFVLGTPLIQDSFNQDRWDYYYSLRNSEKEFNNKKFTVYFNDDKLVRAEGDYQLPSGETENDRSESADAENENNDGEESSNSTDQSAAL